MEILTKNHTYLLKNKISKDLISVKILLVTNTAYKIAWNNNSDDNGVWELQENIDEKYYVIEDVSDYVDNEQKFHTEYVGEYTQCHICKGFGTIPDPSSTTGTKLCPMCFGNKIIKTK